MTYFSHIRAGLISTALLLTTALASPALAETLPEISPRQIAGDVEVRQNPQTGAREFIAPSFDPFEEDRSMAGTASLRSVSRATTIDGQSVRGGAAQKDVTVRKVEIVVSAVTAPTVLSVMPDAAERIG